MSQPTPCSQPNPCEDGELCDVHETEQAHAEGEHAYCGATCEVEYPSDMLRNAILCRAIPGSAGMLDELLRRAAARPASTELPSPIGYEFRESLLVLLSRVQRGVQSASEADLLRSHIEHLLTEHDRLHRDNSQLLEDQAACIELEATIARVRALQTDWLSTGAPPLGTSIARWWDKRLTELDAALDEPSDGAGADLPADTARHCGGTLTHPGHKFMRLDVVFNCPGNTPKEPTK